MATGQHIGKILLKIRDEEQQKICQPLPKIVTAVPRTYFDPEKSYILVGGLGGFGLELANWLISRNARKIILTSRSGVKTGYQALCIKRWCDKGINVVVTKSDASIIEGAEQLIDTATELAPVGGIFNLAAVLCDSLIENLTENEFRKVAAPKIDGTKNLDVVSRRLCPELEHFVVFSSISCGQGNIGQTNYGWANSAMERIMEQRQTDGKPALAIQWGPIGDVGMILGKL